MYLAMVDWLAVVAWVFACDFVSWAPVTLGFVLCFALDFYE
jgi:hypothetical protein